VSVANEALLPNSDPAGEPRVAVLVRGFELSEKYCHLVESLSNHQEFDTYAFYNAFQGLLDIESCPSLTYTEDDIRALGIEPDSTFIYFCCDILLEHARRLIPDYDIYIMIEYDVDVRGNEGAFFDDLARTLKTERWRDVDIAGPLLVEVTYPWDHTEIAARYFDPVWQLFMPVLIASNRAIERMYRFRLDEGPPDTPTSRRVICEAMVSPFMNEPGYKACDLNEIMPGCYDFWTFYYGLPLLLDAPWRGLDVKLRHPVYSVEAFLEKHLTHAHATRTLRQFVAAVDVPDFPGDSQLRSSSLERARMLLFWAGERPAPAPLSIPRELAPPLIIICDDEDVLVRERGPTPRCLTQLSGRSLLGRLIERRSAEFARIIVLLGPDSSAIRAALASELTECVCDDPSAPDVWSGRLKGGQDGAVQIVHAPGPFAARWRRALEVAGERRVLLDFGNVWSDVDLNALVAAHDSQGAAVTLATCYGGSVPIALDEHIRVVSAESPGLGHLRVLGGTAVVDATALTHDESGTASAGQVLIWGPQAAGGLHLFEHEGFCQGVATEREAHVLEELCKRHPEILQLNSAGVLSSLERDPIFAAPDRAQPLPALDALTSRAWRLSRHDEDLSPFLLFRDAGEIVGDRDPSAARWTFDDGRLAFRDSMGRMTARFDRAAADESGKLILRASDKEGQTCILHEVEPLGPLAEPDPALQLECRTLNARRRNLVVVRAGSNSLHPMWERNVPESDRSWDLCVSAYGDLPPEAADMPVEFHVEQRNVRKYEALYRLMHIESELWEYDYIAFPDDDLLMSFSDLNDLFDVCRDYDLRLAHPSQSPRGHISYPEMHQHHGYALRFVSLTELMMPVFSREALKLCAPTFALQPNGYGADYAWSKLLGGRRNSIAIVDKVSIVHTRPVATTYDQDSEMQEGMRIASRFGKGGFFAMRILGGIYARPLGSLNTPQSRG
jgi:hypothetical protein